VVYIYQLPVQKEILKDIARLREKICGVPMLGPAKPADIFVEYGGKQSDIESTLGSSSVAHHSNDHRSTSKNSFFTYSGPPSTEKGEVPGTSFAFLQELRYSLSDLLLIPASSDSGGTGELDLTYYRNTFSKNTVTTNATTATKS
jgi:hypothetical protein